MPAAKLLPANDNYAPASQLNTISPAFEKSIFFENKPNVKSLWFFNAV